MRVLDGGGGRHPYEAVERRALERAGGPVALDWHLLGLGEMVVVPVSRKRGKESFGDDFGLENAGGGGEGGVVTHKFGSIATVSWKAAGHISV